MSGIRTTDNIEFLFKDLMHSIVDDLFKAAQAEAETRAIEAIENPVDAKQATNVVKLGDERKIKTPLKEHWAVQRG